MNGLGYCSTSHFQSPVAPTNVKYAGGLQIGCPATLRRFFEENICPCSSVNGCWFIAAASNDQTAAVSHSCEILLGVTSLVGVIYILAAYGHCWLWLG